MQLSTRQTSVDLGFRLWSLPSPADGANVALPISTWTQIPSCQFSYTPTVDSTIYIRVNQSCSTAAGWVLYYIRVDSTATPTNTAGLGLVLPFQTMRAGSNSASSVQETQANCAYDLVAGSPYTFVPAVWSQGVATTAFGGVHVRLVALAVPR